MFAKQDDVGITKKSPCADIALVFSWALVFMYLSKIAPTLASWRAPPTCAGKELSSGRGRRLLPPGHLLPLLLLLLLLPLLLPPHSLPHLNHHSHHHCCLPTSTALLTFTAAADHLGIWRAQSQLALGGSSLCNALPPTTRPETTPVSWRPVRPPWARPPLQPPSTSWIPGLSAPRPNPLPHLLCRIPQPALTSWALLPQISLLSFSPKIKELWEGASAPKRPPLWCPEPLFTVTLVSLRVSGDLPDRNFLVKMNYLLPRANLPTDTHCLI